MTSTERLAQFVATTQYEDIPQEAIIIAKNALLDWLSVTIAGSKEPGVMVLSQYARELGARSETSVICQGFKTGAELGALANGTMGHALDFDDTFANSVRYGMHPSCTIFPAVLALAEKNGLSGRELLTAYIVGMEVEYRIGAAMGQLLTQQGWHSTPVLGTLGAAAAVAKALNLNLSQIKMALGIASSLAGGIGKNVGTMTKPMHAGNAARNGIISTALAAGGFTGSSDVLEGESSFCQIFSRQEVGLMNEVVNLGQEWMLVSTGLGFKPYPSCRATHASIDAILHLKEKYNINPDQVAAITCKLNSFIARNITSMPVKGYEAKFSVDYCIALALLYGKVSLEHFTDEWVTDQRIQQLMQKVSLLSPEGWDTGTLDLIAEIGIRLKNGEEYSYLVDKPKGEPENPMNYEELVSKFKSCAGSVHREEEMIGIVDLIQQLEEINELTEFFTILRGA